MIQDREMIRCDYTTINLKLARTCLILINIISHILSIQMVRYLFLLNKVSVRVL